MARIPKSLTDEPRWEKGDPLRILLKRESRTCAGCAYLKTDRLFNTTAVACHKRKRKAELSVEKTRRCELFEDGSTK
ncbi:hypothetical protein ACFSHT_22345 [Paraburkholderia silviterrae]|uniref:Uncharacterized protein n=1 Tax=Paraburkholderia silviterrae TaxID=2528715 RepID=A0A4R5MFR4_9BURK|nr:hypothetical protein [Paraburkholderia silviterrae]TDG25877.1 hypothetical protein EYW47_00460 [Paraburkholderia silviterrae]